MIYGLSNLKVIYCLLIDSQTHTVPKNFVGEHFGVSENFGYRKILCITEGRVSRSPSKTFCHTVPKNFFGEHFGVSENFMHKKGISLKISENYYCQMYSSSRSIPSIMRHSNISHFHRNAF